VLARIVFFSDIGHWRGLHHKTALQFAGLAPSRSPAELLVHTGGSRYQRRSGAPSRKTETVYLRRIRNVLKLLTAQPVNLDAEGRGAPKRHGLRGVDFADLDERETLSSDE